MGRCPMGEQCVGCQYGTNCARPKVQAERLRAEVARLTRERDEARRAALEEAAGIADASADLVNDEPDAIATVFQIAAAIRAAAKEERR